mmetsp:Transcript_12365/g.21128  ORF Transcript_12365/g.21128 Transcript_12365/m.21128 type:complete len:199 (+) Transcript_12365:345-941(+)
MPPTFVDYTLTRELSRDRERQNSTPEAEAQVKVQEQAKEEENVERTASEIINIMENEKANQEQESMTTGVDMEAVNRNIENTTNDKSTSSLTEQTDDELRKFESFQRGSSVARRFGSARFIRNLSVSSRSNTFRTMSLVAWECGEDETDDSRHTSSMTHTSRKFRKVVRYQAAHDFLDMWFTGQTPLTSCDIENVDTP